MAFDANRDIKVEGSQGEDGLFTLRTKGLADRRRPELEMSGLPEAALRAAAGVINKVADYTVNEAEVMADQNIALFLPRDDDDDRPLILALHTVASEAPKTGFFARLGGSAKGVLRLVDIAGDRERAPLTAVATMLVFRAALRRQKGDEAGAREELQAAIEIFPGEEDAGADPVIGDGESIYNWQNHLAYLALAETDEDDEDGAAFFRQAVARSDALSLVELGAPLRELMDVDPDALEGIAAQIVGHNLAGDPRCNFPVPSPAHAVFASPIWQPVGDGKVGRSATLVPAKFRELYYDGAAAEGLRRDGARIAANAVRDALGDPALLAWSIRDVRGIWKDDHAPITETIGDLHPAHGLLSSVLVFAARCFRAGATEEQIATGLRDGGESALLDVLAEQVEWETAQYAAAMSVGEA